MNTFRHEGKITIDDLQEFIQRFEVEELPRLNKLYNYYIGKHDILNRVYQDGKPEARIVHNFANYITNQTTGYFMGVPVSYTGMDDVEGTEDIQQILDYNDEADTNVTHAENMAVYGKSYELLYVDKSQMVDTRFSGINPREIFTIHDYSLEANIIAAVRFYHDGDDNLKVELYEENTISYLSGDKYSLSVDDTVNHFFKDVPVVVYTNNNTTQGDFEPVIGLIDQYNRLNSDTANDFEYFSDAYLFLSGATIDDEDARNMKENRIINIDDPQARAEFLTKTIQDEALENFKNRLVSDIHKFSAVPNMSDESFASNLSGVAIKYKILGLENMAAMKERKFKKALQRRFELMMNLLYARGKLSSLDYMAIKPTFKRSLPSNLLEEADIAVKLENIISKESLLDMLSIIEDAQVELEQIEDEKSEEGSFIDEGYTADLLRDLEASTDEYRQEDTSREG